MKSIGRRANKRGGAARSALTFVGVWPCEGAGATWFSLDTLRLCKPILLAMEEPMRPEKLRRRPTAAAPFDASLAPAPVMAAPAAIFRRLLMTTAWGRVGFVFFSS